jgi:hypothetical protein
VPSDRLAAVASAGGVAESSRVEIGSVLRVKSELFSNLMPLDRLCGLLIWPLKPRTSLTVCVSLEQISFLP